MIVGLFNECELFSQTGRFNTVVKLSALKQNIRSWARSWMVAARAALNLYLTCHWDHVKMTERSFGILTGPFIYEFFVGYPQKRNE